MKHVVLLKSHLNQHGGLEKYADRIAQGFVERGLKVSILTTGSHYDDPSIHAVKTCRWPAFWRMEQFDRFVNAWLKENSHDLVFGLDRNRTQTHYRAGNGVHAAFLRSRCLLEGPMKRWSFLINPLHLKILQIEKCAFENPNLQKLFTNSYLVRDQILEFYSADPKKIEVIHNGVEWHEMDRDFHEWPVKKEEVLRKKGLDPSAFQFLFIGNGYLRKGLRHLLIALSRLKEDFQLSIVGKDNRAEEYCALAEKLNLGNKVHFFGSQKEIRPFYQFADALVIPSFYDPFANVTVEALAMGLFVVSSKLNGGHEILHPNNGHVVENLLEPDSILDSLLAAMRHRKTKPSAEAIRQTVKHLDFSHQMQLLIDHCLLPKGAYGS